jgi:hypothetical protein
MENGCEDEVLIFDVLLCLQILTLSALRILILVKAGNEDLARARASRSGSKPPPPLRD